jgi:hypothetical protein
MRSPGRPPVDRREIQQRFLRKISEGLSHRPLEPEQYTAIRFTQRLADAGIQPSMGSVGDSFDNALAENFFSALKIVLVYRPGHRLLDIEPDRANAFATQAVAGWLGIKPGWTRLSFSFYLSEAEFDYLVQAVHLVATHGHRLLGDYRFDPRSGLWRHRRAPLPLPGLHQFAFDPDLWPRHRNGGGHRRVSDRALADYLRTARAILAAHPDPDGDGQAPPVLPERLERLRWFELPRRLPHRDPLKASSSTPMPRRRPAFTRSLRPPG